MSGEWSAQIDVKDTQFQIISNTRKERDHFFTLLKNMLKVGKKTSHITYFTFQHSFEKEHGKWWFSNYDNITEAATRTEIMGNENVFRYIHSDKRGATSLKQAKIGLEKVIQANKGTKGEYAPTFRIVKVTHFFDIVEIV